jgi:hypothetical protein
MTLKLTFHTSSNDLQSFTINLVLNQRVPTLRNSGTSTFQPYLWPSPFSYKGK